MKIIKKSVILNFHKETDGEMFEKIIIALKSRYTLVNLDFIENSFVQKKEFKDICHITFDDGDLSFYQIIFPLLKKHNVSVTLFVSPKIVAEQSNFWFQEIEDCDPNAIRILLAKKTNVSIEILKHFKNEDIFKCLPVKDIIEIVTLYRKENNLGKTSPKNINLEQLKEVEDSGLVTIGAHTLHHPILQNEDDTSSFQEISFSIKQLEALLHHPITCFAYPNGRPDLDFGEREERFLMESGITMCFSTELDHLSLKSNKLSIPRMGFPRMGLSPSNPLIAFRLFFGKNWPDIKEIVRTSEKNTRQQIYNLINNN